MSIDARIARGGVLALWAIFFVLLWWTGTSGRYLGTRTQWIVPFGAVVLALASLAYGLVADHRDDVRFHGLSQHHERMLRYLGVDAPALGIAPTTARHVLAG
jgi:hypothetical protein